MLSLINVKEYELKRSQTNCIVWLLFFEVGGGFEPPYAVLQTAA